MNRNPVINADQTARCQITLSDAMLIVDHVVFDSSRFSGDARDEFGLEYWREAPEKVVKSESQEMELSVSLSADRISHSALCVECGESKLGLAGA